MDSVACARPRIGDGCRFSGFTSSPVASWSGDLELLDHLFIGCDVEWLLGSAGPESWGTSLVWPSGISGRCPLILLLFLTCWPRVLGQLAGMALVVSTGVPAYLAGGAGPHSWGTSLGPYLQKGATSYSSWSGPSLLGRTAARPRSAVAVDT